MTIASDLGFVVGEWYTTVDEWPWGVGVLVQFIVDDNSRAPYFKNTLGEESPLNIKGDHVRVRATQEPVFRVGDTVQSKWEREIRTILVLFEVDGEPCAVCSSTAPDVPGVTRRLSELTPVPCIPDPRIAELKEENASIRRQVHRMKDRIVRKMRYHKENEATILKLGGEV